MRRLLLALILLPAALALQALAPVRPAAARAKPRARGEAVLTRTRTLGASVQRRPIVVLERGDPDTRVHMLIVGCIHGNESAGIAVAERLESVPLPDESDIWIVENANPDGVAADRRTNAHGVDLNRNFPWRWRPQGRPGEPHYSGPRPLSEPESRLLARLIVRLRPQVTVWFHQPYGVVDESGGSIAVERRFASLVGLPLVRLARYPGGATDWQNSLFPRTTAFVVELPPGSVGSTGAARYARGLTSLLARG